MRESEHGEVLEYVGMGLGMRRVLRVDSGDLFFTSDGYFWAMFGGRIPIPDALIPGKTFLSHCNDNPAQFNISIEIRHCLFGTTFRQVGGGSRDGGRLSFAIITTVTLNPLKDLVIARSFSGFRMTSHA